MPLINCGSSSTVMFTNFDEEFGAIVTLGGVQYAVPAYESFFVPCYGELSISVPYYVGYTAVPAPLPELHNDYAFSFLWGLLAAFAFAVASIRRWF